VAVPRGVCLESAKTVALQKRSWIKEKQRAVERIEQEHAALVQACGYISKPAAKGIIIGRLEELAQRHHIVYNKVSVRNQKTRWGSCSSGKNISLNYKITLLPPELMDYIFQSETNPGSKKLRHKNGRHPWMPAKSGLMVELRGIEP